MKARILFFLLPALCLLAADADRRPVHIFMAGDSTMADKVLYKPVADPQSGALTPEAFPERGWGMLLPEFFSDRAVVENFARNGRSTRSFIREGLWDKLLSGVRKGDYIIIQFGHNDGAENRPDRYTPPDDYRQNLIRFIDESRAKGGIPVLCTPVVRRKFGADGKIDDSHGVYPDVVRQVAKQKKTFLVDMHELTREWMDQEGDVASRRYYMHFPAGVHPHFPNGLSDNTHYVAAGARKAASLFVGDLERQDVRGLTRLLKKNVPPYISSVWVADLGNGQYKNPILMADYSDPDVCRVGGDYYMTSSSFQCVPGLPVLHSRDLVNWTLVGAALPRLMPAEVFARPQHGNGVWAPAIRHYAGRFYIYYGDPDQGIFMTRTADPAGEWEPPVLVKAGKGLIDPCPFWDDDGQAYLVHAYAGSRAGIKSLLALTRLTPDGTQAVGLSKIIYDGHDADETVEGPKFYKRNGYYYIFAPAGGVATGWQIALRSRRLFGPYERKMVMAQGGTSINGPHQGAWVDTSTGEDWFFHFQDRGAFGRVVHLQPMRWANDWPVIGADPDGDGCGEPVSSFRKPDTGEMPPVATPIESDEFVGDRLGAQWQWHANPAEWWYATRPDKGVLSLYSVPVGDAKNLWDVPNLLLQKFPADRFTVTAKLSFFPSDKIRGERTGLVIMGLDYALLALTQTEAGFLLSQNECRDADRGGPEVVLGSALLKSGTVFLRVTVSPDATCRFTYSLNGRDFSGVGSAFTAREGKWIGGKVGLFCSRPVGNNDGGLVEVDWVRVE
jgi:beta-xylosidase/lysophospholipase L1-like esterase